ncbi:MAG TPA: tetratricopeptide repeat protein, partial [Ramlibacter sp.]|nr:tetratricopeptide repeat protein [Ramlibacter sp.]
MSTPRVPTVRTGRTVASLIPPLALAIACALAGSALAQTPPATGQAAVDNRSVDQLVDAARQAARTDRNRESADLFALAIARAPQRRRELLREYADQLTYSDRSAAAVPLYRELLTPEPPPDERLRTLNGLGLALLWSDRPSQARRVYEEIVREQPDNRDAARNLGRAITWSGRQREAVRYLEALLQAHPDDDEARVMLAQARAWMGRNDLARRELGGKAAERDDARRLRDDLNWATDPRTRLELQYSTQSDNLDITGSRFKQEFSFNEGLGTGELRIEHIDFRLQNGSDDAIVDRAFLHGRYRLGDDFEVNAEAAPERVRPRGSPVDEHLVYSAWLTWWPGDVLRFDLSTNQASFDNLKSLRLGLLARQYALSTDVTP